MLNYVYRSLKLLLIPVLVLLSGCEVPLIYLCNAGNSQKNVSDDYKRGHVMGKEYVLLLDGFVTQFKDSKELYFEKNLTTVYTFENGNEVSSSKIVDVMDFWFVLFKVFSGCLYAK